MSFDIRFDYRFDTRGFFDDPAVRAALEAAGALWEEAILDEFEDVPAGVSFSTRDPSTGLTAEVTIDEPIDDLLIFVAGAPLQGALANAGPSGFDAGGDRFSARISPDFRGQGPATDFEPYTGNMRFSTTATWSFDLDGPVPGRSDFLSTAAHEIGHVLGIGTAPAFDALVEDDAFTGANARALNGGAPLPLEPDGHVEDGFDGGRVLLDPTNTVGERKMPTDVDFALLADIGYEIAGFEARGTRFPLATEAADDPVLGADVADRILLLGGDDRAFLRAGDDTAFGGAGDDVLRGEEGDDLLVGGPGDDTLTGDAGADRFAVAPGDGADTINDFEPGIDRIRIDPAFGFASVAEVLATLDRPFTNASRLTLDAGTSVLVFDGGAGLTERDFAFGTALDAIAATVVGTPGADAGLSGGGGDDAIDALAGDDTIRATGGQDVVDGGAGEDRVLFEGARPEGLAAEGAALSVPVGTGRTLMTGVERAVFEDGQLLLDLAGEDVGFAYRIYAAVFGRTPDEAGLRFWAGRLDTLTDGIGRAPAERLVAEAFVENPEFDARFGAEATDRAYVAALYTQALGREPDEAGFDFWLEAFSSGRLERSDMLVAFTDSPENIDRTADDLAFGAFVLPDTDLG